MKNQSERVAFKAYPNKFHKKTLTIVLLGIVFFLSSLGNILTAQVQVGVNLNFSPPVWAPQYTEVNRVQYYYLPDIESYYDVSHQEFIYLENGNWVFARQLPPHYSWFDINNSFTVLLDYRANDPWRYHNFYVEHYPRFYYRTIYRTNYDNREHPVRGFNENSREVVYRNADRREERHEERREEYKGPSREPQRMEHYGKNVGTPVPVQIENKNRGQRENRDRRDNRNNGERRKD